MAVSATVSSAKRLAHRVASVLLLVAGVVFILLVCVWSIEVLLGTQGPLPFLREAESLDRSMSDSVPFLFVGFQFVIMALGRLRTGPVPPPPSSPPAPLMSRDELIRAAPWVGKPVQFPKIGLKGGVYIALVILFCGAWWMAYLAANSHRLRPQFLAVSALVFTGVGLVQLIRNEWRLKSAEPGSPGLSRH
jgi:hypothetical protein